MTHGRVDAAPFVLHAVSSSAAPAQYRAKGSTATLYAFQPREQTPASAWSGEQLTGAARYTNGNHPETAATPADSSLADFLQGYPAIWDGFVEVRMYLGAPGQPFDSVNYAATDIQVSGNNWRSVDGGTVDCHAGTAVSNETLLLPKSDLRARPTSEDTTSERSHHPASTRSGGSPAGTAGSPTRPGSVRSSPVADSRTSASHSLALGLALGTAVLVLVLGAGGYALVRRRR